MINKIYEKFIFFIKSNYKFLIVLTVIIFLFYYELPYVIYKRGGTIDLTDRVIIDTDYEETGNLSMSYVTAIKGTIPFILISYIMPDWDLVPLSDITDEDNDYEDVLEIGKMYLNEGIDNAIIAAFNESGYGITINRTINTVMYIDGYANTDIILGDEIISVNDRDIEDIEMLKEYINTLEEGNTVEVKVINNDEYYTRYANVYKASDDTLKIGIAFKTTYDYETEIPVTVSMKDNESGSSGGLMMSLAIYNALTDYDITNGLNIVGTGAIESDGTVEEISGVKYKVLAAVKNDADIFLCPEENYAEAINIKKERDLDIEIVGVSSLKEAIEYLTN